MNNLETYKKRILITGGAGFIGSHVVRHFVNKYPEYLIVNFDALTYAGNLENLKDIEDKPNYVFVRGDITQKENFSILDEENGGLYKSRCPKYVFETYKITDVIHMAAESHVDRSMVNPTVFAETNVMGTLNLLNVCREYWKDNMENHKFFNMGTDEIFGSLTEEDEAFNENTPLNPHSPYSTSKTAQIMFGKTYYEAYGLPVVSMACGNAIGPNQFPEKLVPLAIDKLVHGEKIPVYGEGLQMRDWTNVHDICTAIDLVFHKGTNGELYCIGGDACKHNIDIVKDLITYNTRFIFENNKMINVGIDPDDCIEYIKDPRGKSHDFRYDINHNKITEELGWKPEYTYERSIRETLRWYLDNQEWTEHCKSGEYKKWINSYYK